MEKLYKLSMAQVLQILILEHREWSQMKDHILLCMKVRGLFFRMTLTKANIQHTVPLDGKKVQVDNQLGSL